MSAEELQTGSDPNGEAPEPSKVFIDESEWVQTQTELAELRGYKKAMDEMELRLGNRMPEVSQTPTPPPAPKPEFQYHSDEELQRVLDEGDLKAYHKMSRHNSDTKLREEIWNLKTTEIEPLRKTGSQALSDLSGRFASQAMEHLDIPEVKKTYEKRLGDLKATGQVLNAEVHQAVYEWAVGSNLPQVQEKLQQGFLRQQQEQVNTPTSTSGRGQKTDVVRVPAVEEFFDAPALAFLQRKHQGMSAQQAADTEFKRHGGFEGYYRKFYGPKKEEEGK